MRTGNRGSFLFAVVSIAMGMGGELHLALPALGFIAMTDLLAYVMAIPVMFMCWNRMGRFMRRSLCWAFAWTCAAMLANAFNFVDMKYWLKCVVLASSSWALMLLAYFVLRDYPRGFLWYLVGVGIGGWISLHYFRNGALEHFATQGMGPDTGLGHLQDKQVYPAIARGILYGLVLPLFIWWKKLPIFVILCATTFAGFWLLFHGGSRSNFGIFCAAAGAGFMVAYGTRMFRQMAKRPFLMLMLVGLALSVLFGSYKILVKSGAMGEGELRKYESEFGEGSEGAINGRAGLKYAIIDAWDSCLLGKGWHLRNHSVMANALACEGLIGFLFWIFFYSQVLWWVGHRIPYSGKNTTFIILIAITACWSVFGSPFGTRHKYFVLMALIALCRDNPYYGIGTLFDSSMIVGRRRFWHE